MPWNEVIARPEKNEERESRVGRPADNSRRNARRVPSRMRRARRSAIREHVGRFREVPVEGEPEPHPFVSGRIQPGTPFLKTPAAASPGR